MLSTDSLDTFHSSREWSQKTLDAVSQASSEAKPVSFFKKAYEGALWSDRTALEQTLGRELFPEQAQVLDRLTSRSYERQRTRHWSMLFQASLESPGVVDIRTFVEQAAKTAMKEKRGLEESALPLYELAVRELASEQELAEFALQISGFRTRPINRMQAESILGLYRGVVQGGGEFGLLDTVSKTADEGDRKNLVASVGTRLLQSLEPAIDESLINQCKAGKLSVGEIRALVDDSQSKTQKSELSDVLAEEDYLIFDDEVLEVDL